MTGWQWLGAAILGAMVLAFVVWVWDDQDFRDGVKVIAVCSVLVVAFAMLMGAFP